MNEQGLGRIIYSSLVLGLGGTPEEARTLWSRHAHDDLRSDGDPVLQVQENLAALRSDVLLGPLREDRTRMALALTRFADLRTSLREDQESKKRTFDRAYAQDVIAEIDFILADAEPDDEPGEDIFILP